MNFKDFILNESGSQSLLGSRIGDILNALQDLSENGKSMGTRQMVEHAESIVNQLRSILHSHWSKKEQKHLGILQKVGVAIMKAIDEKGDLHDVVQGASEELEKYLKYLGVPQNKLGTQDATSEPAGEQKSLNPAQGS